MFLRPAAVVMFVLALTGAAEAKASVDVCNHFTKWVFVADAYYDDSRLRKDFVSTGWTKVLRGECAQVYLGATIDWIFLYVTSSTYPGGYVYLEPLTRSFCLNDSVQFLIGYADDSRRCLERNSPAQHEEQRLAEFRAERFAQYRMPPSYAGELDLKPGGGPNHLTAVWGAKKPFTPPPDYDDETSV